MYDSGNRSNWIALQENVSEFISAEKGGKTDTKTVTVDNTFYSQNPETLRGAETDLILLDTPQTASEWFWYIVSFRWW